MSFKLNLNQTTPWTLINLDTGQAVVGPYPPTSLTRNVASEIGTATSLGREHPIVQWLGGSTETVAFEATLYAETFLDRIEDKVEELLALAHRDEALGRPPIVQFVYGALTFRALVQELGGIKYGDLRPNGTYRRVDFAITLVRYEPLDLVATDPTAPEPSTRFHVVPMARPGSPSPAMSTASPCWREAPRPASNLQTSNPATW